MRVLGLLAVVGCAATPPAPEHARRPACSEALLAAFDPGTAVAERRTLPPVRQKLAEQTTHVANVVCEADEPDADCEDRVTAVARRTYPRPAKIRATTYTEVDLLRAHIVVDGEEHDVDFATPVDLQTHLLLLREAGRAVEVTEIERVSTPNARRFVRLVVSGPEDAEHDELLRMRLTLAPVHNDLMAMLTLHERATRQAFGIQTFTKAEDNTIVVELTCRRSQSDS